MLAVWPGIFAWRFRRAGSWVYVGLPPGCCL